MESKSAIALARSSRKDLKIGLHYVSAASAVSRTSQGFFISSTSRESDCNSRMAVQQLGYARPDGRCALYDGLENLGAAVDVVGFEAHGVTRFPKYLHAATKPPTP
jgi:hypothetical protein